MFILNSLLWVIRIPCALMFLVISGLLPRAKITKWNDTNYVKVLKRTDRAKENDLSWSDVFSEGGILVIYEHGLTTLYVLNEIRWWLSSQDFFALLLHERGHLYHRHATLNNKHLLDVSKGYRVLRCPECEHEADLYALRWMPENVYLEALKSYRNKFRFLIFVSTHVKLTDILGDNCV